MENKNKILLTENIKLKNKLSDLKENTINKCEKLKEKLEKLQEEIIILKTGKGNIYHQSE